jgi:hypothetical protein
MAWTQSGSLEAVGLVCLWWINWLSINSSRFCLSSAFGYLGSVPGSVNLLNRSGTGTTEAHELH